MQLKKNFDYYENLNTTVTNALLHLLSQVAMTSRHVPIAKRNEILIKYLKPKANIKALANIKKDIKLMLSIARKNGANLERRLFELQDNANQSTLVGAERLYSLLVYLYDEAGFELRLFEEGSEAEEGIIYMLQEHIEHGFNDKDHVAPLSMLIQSEKAPSLINTINQHGWFEATMKEWNADTHQAHIQIHPLKISIEQHVRVNSD